MGNQYDNNNRYSKEFQIDENKNSGNDFKRETKSEGGPFSLEKDKKVEHFRTEKDTNGSVFRSESSLNEVRRSIKREKEVNNYIEKDRRYSKYKKRALKLEKKIGKTDKKIRKHKYKKKIDKNGNVTYKKVRAYAGSKGKNRTKSQFITKIKDTAISGAKKGLQQVKSLASENFKEDNTAGDFRKSADMYGYVKRFADRRGNRFPNLEKLERKNEKAGEELKKLQKKMYKRRGIRTYRYNHGKTTAEKGLEAVKKNAKKMAEAAAKSAAGKAVIIAGVLILIMTLFVTCGTGALTGILGGTESVAIGTYVADRGDIEAAEEYFNHYEMLLAKAIYGFEDGVYQYLADRYGAVNGVYTTTDADGREVENLVKINYDLTAVKHNPNTLIAYLTVVFNDFHFPTLGYLSDNEVAKHIIDPLFVSCYNIAPIPPDQNNNLIEFTWGDLFPITEVTVSEVYSAERATGSVDINGNPVMETYYYKYINYNVTGGFRSLDDVVAERIEAMGESASARYNALCGTYGGLYVASNIIGEENIRNHIREIYGNVLDVNDYFNDRWSPAEYSGERTECSNNYARINCIRYEDAMSVGRDIYAGAAGFVKDVTEDSVTVEIESTVFAERYIRFFDLDEVYVTWGQEVAQDTKLGHDEDYMNLQYYETNYIGGVSTYYNPFFYIK